MGAKEVVPDQFQLTPEDRDFMLLSENYRLIRVGETFGFEVTTPVASKRNDHDVAHDLGLYYRKASDEKFIVSDSCLIKVTRDLAVLTQGDLHTTPACLLSWDPNEEDAWEKRDRLILQARSNSAQLLANRLGITVDVRYTPMGEFRSLEFTFEPEI